MKFSKKDPNYAREAQKYDNPIPSREFLLDLITRQPAPPDFDTLVRLLELEGDEERIEALRRRLRAMERDGQLIVNRQGRFVPLAEGNLVVGRVVGHPDGFGFLIPDDGSDDLFLSPREMRQVLHGDRVVACEIGVDRRGRREGRIVEVLERQNQTVVGQYIEEGGVGFVIPDNKRISQDIVIPPDQRGEARDGQIVVAAILEQPNRKFQPIGKIVEILGDHRDPGMEIDIAIRAHGIPFQWPQEVQDEAAGFGSEVPEAAKKGRLDLRKTPLVTIDGEDAKDFDDAVFCEPEGEGWRLLVAIADVSHYVAPDSALDREARERGNSVYFPEHVVPMLPEVLSNGLCSLNPEVDRLCMVCEMHISKTGRLESFRFHEGLMRSHARLTYDEMAEIVVDRKIEARKRRGDLVVHLDRLYELYKVLHKARQRRGAIDFETVETRIEFNDQRKIERIVPVIRNDAHRLIEECMILANVAAARFLEKKKICTLYRIHEGPAEDRLEDVRTFLAELGLSLGGGDSPTAKDYARLLKQVQGRPDAQLIQTVLLRSLKQAVYSPDNKGHFGLSLKAYTHFTSPIRRYPDLLVHRAIRHLLRGGKPEEFRYGHADMEVLGDHCSQTERRADEATRDVMDWLKTEYMQDKLGEEFDGIITSVTSFGLFVQLTDIYVEGLVHVTSLKSDYYRFDPVGHRLIGENSGRVYRLGDPIRVLVARVDLEEKKIDFQPVETEDEADRKPARKSRRGGKGRGKGKGGGKPGSKAAASGKRKGKKKGK